MSTWNKDMQNSVKSARNLVDEGLIPPEAETDAGRLSSAFPVRIPPAYLNLLGSDTNADPIWRTAVPTLAEEISTAEELIDPIGDENHSPVRYITHRHRDRVLLMLTLVCAVYCRFCFRRYAVGQAEQMPSKSEIDNAIRYVEEHAEIWEVILTGGDPLILSDSRLDNVLNRLRTIEHLGVIRIHTRVPVVLPSRITPDLITILRGRGRDRAVRPVWVVLHVNHPQELSDTVSEVLGDLADNGIPLLNQTVLLRGINDSREVLECLNRKLVSLRVKPYYLHHGDLARGTGHFRTDLKAGIELARSMRGDVSGLCQPTYVIDIPGGYGKVPVDSSFVQANDNGRWDIEDPYGGRHIYPPENS